MSRESRLLETLVLIQVFVAILHLYLDYRTATEFKRGADSVGATIKRILG